MCATRHLKHQRTERGEVLTTTTTSTTTACEAVLLALLEICAVPEVASSWAVCGQKVSVANVRLLLREARPREGSLG